MPEPHTLTISEKAAIAGDQMMDFNDILAQLNLGRRTLRRLISMGVFPAADLAVGRGIRRWWPKTVERFVQRNGS